MPRCSLVLALLLLCPTLAAGQEPVAPWAVLSQSACGVDTFATAHPAWNGAGVVVAVLDTGVELNAPGLQWLPDGARKVVDVQDFTGEGDLTWARAEPGPGAGEVTLRDEAQRPVVCTLPSKTRNTSPEGEWYYTWFREDAYKNGREIADFDDDGKLETAIPILIVPTTINGQPRFVAIFDRNQNRDFGDEQVLADYRVRYDHLILERTRPEAQRKQITLAVNLFPEERRLSMHFDDGGHGTHVAGIAAGYKLGGHAEFHGIAPGAQVISLKIGNNLFAGGSTTPGSKLSAVRYAARYAREHNVPVICNISYGILGARDGSSTIDEGMQKVLEENPNLIICASAGNEGPGLGSMGTPATAPSVFAIAAALPRETARDGRGDQFARDAIAVFSSRGAESLKPDLLTPGYATSSVPLYNRGGDFWQGTSMASPYAAGLCARLVSAHRLAHPKAAQPSRESVRRALAASGRSLTGYTVLDYGAGMPDINRAFTELERLVANQRPDDPSALLIATQSPQGQGEMPVALWRGLTLPTDPQEFTLTARFPSQGDREVDAAFNRRYTVTSLADWIVPVEQTVYLRREQSATITVHYNTAGLRAPGFYVGDVALREEGTPPGAYPDAIARTVLIVPERFDAAHDYRIEWAGQEAPADWRMNRHFLYIPPYASAVRFRLEAPEPREYGAAVRALFLPDGAQRWTQLSLPETEARDREEWVWSEGLMPGVIELPVYEPSGETSGPYTLRAELIAVHADPARVTVNAARGENPPKLELSLHNALERELQVTAEATIDAHRTHKTVTFGGEDAVRAFTHSFTLGEGYAGARVRVRFTREGYLQFTDIPWGFYDANGTVLTTSGVGGLTDVLTIDKSGDGEQTVELRLEPAYTEDWNLPEVTATLELDLILAAPIHAALHPDRSKNTTFPLAPGITLACEAAFETAPLALPEGMRLAGECLIAEADTGAELRRVPIDFE